MEKNQKIVNERELQPSTFARFIHTAKLASPVPLLPFINKILILVFFLGGHWDDAHIHLTNQTKTVVAPHHHGGSLSPSVAHCCVEGLPSPVTVSPHH
jgi:hypothetical protein